MGIDLPAFEFLLKANAEFGDFGSTVVLGRQRLLMRDENARARFGAVLERYRPDLSLDDIADENVDRLISALGGDPYQVMDNSAYEGAQVIHDLNEPLPNELKGKFDTVIDIGTLEHVFNIATAMKSVAEAVRVGGQFLCLNIANNHLGHGFWQFSPEVFFRTFSPAHGFEPRLADLYYQGAFHPLRDPLTIGQRDPIKTPGYTYVTFGARKSEERDMFAEGWPVQADYVAAWTLFQVRSAEREGQMETAEATLRDALAKAPENPAYMVALASVLRRTGRHDNEYSELIGCASEAAPDLPSLLNELKASGKSGTATEQPPLPSTNRIDVGPVSLAIGDPRIPEKTEDALKRGRYEFKEREIARRMLGKGDRVIELGAGMGVVSLTIATLVGADAVQSFEANPVIIELARENAVANGLPVTFRHAIASPQVVAEQMPHIEFFVLNSFEASSTRQVSPTQKAIQVATTSLESEISIHRANALVCDIEGFEVEIIEKTDLSGIDKFILEIHPKIIGLDDCVTLIDLLEERGLILRADLAFGDVIAFERGAKAAEMGGGALFAALDELEALIRSKETDRAFAKVAELEDVVNENAYVQFRIAQLEQMTGKDSLLRATRSAELGSEDFLLYTHLAGQYAVLGDKPRAQSALDTLNRLFPRSPSIPALTDRISKLI
ncbi:FkbM family methyltransferase [uncultured Litoreibacter sp.]|uniref:FkbM family methyltransferase n=1 Tax=uncultured Litoreibacter sp. TaxID=1392394 RepID=UPI0026105D59|nr:FkbM family methyltransferase [uncultured Litoreibacter sp.]